MRIISRFHDFYDSGLAFEAGDDQVIFLRDEIKFNLGSGVKFSDLNPIVQKTLSNFYKNVDSKFDPWEWRFKQSTQWRRFELTNKEYYFYHNLINIIFCGKIYPLIRIKAQDKNDNISFINHFYNFNTYQKFLQKHELEFYNARGKAIAEKFFNKPISDDFGTFLIENKITIAVIKEDEISFNSKLNDYEFYKVFDAYTAYQELDTWLSGTLAYPQNIMIEVGNKEKIEKHGFDKKYGFRTRPGKK